MSATRIAGGLMVAALVVGTTACTSAETNADLPTEHSTNSANSSTSVGTTAAEAGTKSEAQPPTEVFKPILRHTIPNVKGKSFTSAIVKFPPGSEALPHRHGQAFVFAYVLEGSVRSQVDDGPVTTYQPGEAWIEAPGAHHRLTENTSASKQAKLLVTFVADTGAELKVDDAHH